MDDGVYLPANPLLHDPDRLWKTWFQPGSFIEYYPLQESVQWLQWQLWHNHTFGYHLTNVVLHVVSSLLLWRLLDKLGLRWAWLGGLIFAIHPANVESVAWIAEFKNTLSLPPFLLAMCFLVDYETDGKPRSYRFALLFFLLAMLCKVSMALFPGVILLYAWWKRGRVGWSDFKAALPFAFISLLLGSMTILSGIWYRQIYIEPSDAIPIGGFLSHFALAGSTTIFYFSKAILPMGPLFIYPQWKIDSSTLEQFLPWVLFLAVLGWCWVKRRGWGRHALLGLGFFILNLAPFVGFNLSTYMRFTWVMDHFLYIPLIGIIGLAVAGLQGIGERLPRSMRWCEMAGIAVAMALLVSESHAYARTFRDQESLWTYTIQHNPKAWIAYNNLGLVEMEKGRTAEALAQYRHAIEIKPTSVAPYINLGNAFQKWGQFEEAMAEYKQALQIRPDDAEAENNWGNALLAENRFGEALGHYQTATGLAPSYVQPRLGLAAVLIQTNHVDEGIEQYRQALRIDPRNASALESLGITLGEAGQMAAAVPYLQEAAQLNPDDPLVLYNLGFALRKCGRTAEAMTALGHARQLGQDGSDQKSSRHP